MRVGFVATGEIAVVMVRGPAGRGHEIHVSARNAEKARALAAEAPEVHVAENTEVVAQSDMVLPRQMAESGAGFENLLKGLATEDGLTDSLKAHMQSAGMPENLVAGLEALVPRPGQ